jgi:hypothetical protein
MVVTMAGETFEEIVARKGITINDAYLVIIVEQRKLPMHGEDATAEQRMRRRLLSIAYDALHEAERA